MDDRAGAGGPIFLDRDAHGYSHTHSHADINSRSDNHTGADQHANGHTDQDADGHTDRYANADPYADESAAPADTHAYPCTDANTRAGRAGRWR